MDKYILKNLVLFNCGSSQRIFKKIKTSGSIQQNILKLTHFANNENVNYFSNPIAMDMNIFNQQIAQIAKKRNFHVESSQQYSLVDTKRLLTLQKINENLENLISVVFGLETHLCVQQTCLDLLELCCPVFVLEDSIGSQVPLEHQAGLLRMKNAGANIISSANMFQYIYYTRNFANKEQKLDEQEEALVEYCDKFNLF